MKINISNKDGIVALCLFSLLVVSTIISGAFSQETTNNLDDGFVIESSVVSEEISQDELKETTKINDDMIRSSASVEEISQGELKERANVILTGTVEEILASKWNTADGKKPDKPIEEYRWSDLIYTDIVISVDEYFKNPQLDNQIIVRVQGGEVGEDTLIADYEASFENDEMVLLFLSEDDSSATNKVGPDHYVVTGSLMGKYTLTDDGNAVGYYGTVTLEQLLTIIDS